MNNKYTREVYNAVIEYYSANYGSTTPAVLFLCFLIHIYARKYCKL